MKYLRAHVIRAETEGDDGNSPIRFVASTEGVKSDGIDLRMEDWDLTRFADLPVILWAHDYFGQTLPIGTGVPLFEGRDLLMDVTFDGDDEFAQRVRKKALHEPPMVGGSVGWESIRDGKTMRNQLLEFSIVPVPMDPAAVPVRHGAREFALTDANVWRGVALAMADLFAAECDLSDEERRYLYNGLSRLYGRLGREAPEWMTRAQCAALGADEYAGLFLENEVDMLPGLFGRYGVVISSRNLADLEQAVTLVNGVVERAKASKEKEPEGDSDEEERAQLEAILNRLQGDNNG